MVPGCLAKVAVAAMALSTAVVVDAHHKMLYPEPFFLVDGNDAQWAPVAILEDQGVNTSADVSGFMKQKGYADLRAMLDDQELYQVNLDALDECGYTDPTFESQPIPTNGTIASTGYIYDGPCEVWLDDLKVMSGDNCRTKFPGTTFKLDYSSCKGSCTLRWYWLGVQLVDDKYSWQVYKECVSLKDDGSSPSSSSSAAISMSDSASGEGTEDEDEVDSTPAPTAAPTSIPKCSVKKSN